MMRISMGAVTLGLVALTAGAARAQGPQGPASDGGGGKARPPQAEAQKRQQGATDDQRGTERSPFAVKAIPPLRTPAEAAQDAADRNSKATTDRWTFWFNGTIASFSVVLAFVALWQAAIARGAARRQLRAYVWVDGGQVTDAANAAKSPVADLTIRNGGQTPAYDVVFWGGIHVGGFPLAAALPAQMPGPHQPRTTLGPGGTASKTLTLGRPLTSVEISQLRAGTLAIYVYGHVTYVDVFTRRRTTQYRLMHSAMTGAIGVTTDLTSCDEGNEAD